MKSFLYHGFGLKDIEHLKTEYEGGAIYVHVQTKEDKLCCSNCKSKKVSTKGSVQRTLRTVPIGLKAVYIVARIQRLHCRECGKIQQETLSWADKKKLIPVG